jgi:ethanolamine utilization protein EutA
MEQEILSAGIDLGTTTSQVIFSRIKLENISYTAVPEIRIKEKEIIYKSIKIF